MSLIERFHCTSITLNQRNGRSVEGGIEIQSYIHDIRNQHCYGQYTCSKPCMLEPTHDLDHRGVQYICTSVTHKLTCSSLALVTSDPNSSLRSESLPTLTFFSFCAQTMQYASLQLHPLHHRHEVHHAD